MGTYVICKTCGAKLMVPPNDGSVSLDGNVQLDGDIRVNSNRIEFGPGGKLGFGPGGIVGFSGPKKLKGTCPVCQTTNTYEPTDILTE